MAKYKVEKSRRTLASKAGEPFDDIVAGQFDKMRIKLNSDDEVDFLDRPVGPRERFALEILRRLRFGNDDSLVKDVCSAAAKHLQMFFAINFVARRPAEENDNPDPDVPCAVYGPDAACGECPNCAFGRKKRKAKR
ncbi:hypothetical protein [Anatilimnocola floriformis]|uniref:hypothetical protein n=1 Tax=Anatilimnocola floriformis TaxID=2948575 RepID=UPI0020C1D4EC|nr:hypothetical protein [Anatilimnocola floriformis]